MSCWLFHKWDRYEAPVEETYDVSKDSGYTSYPRYDYTITKIFQKKTCLECGMVKRVLVDSYIFNKETEKKYALREHSKI